MSKLITDWIQGKRNFTYGTILYKRFGTNEELKDLFEKGKTVYTEKKLFECLQQLHRDETNPAPSPQERGWGEAERGEAFPESKDKILTALRAQWMPLYTEMNYKRHQIDIYLFRNSDAAMRKRGELAFEILALEKRCIAIWQKRDYYIKFGRLENTRQMPEPVVNPVKLGQRYKNVQGYIRRYRMYLRKDATNENSIAMLKKYEEELAIIKEQIGE